MQKVNCIIMDWAGTAIDYGCFAPVDAFAQAFNDIQVPVTVAEIRIPMGLAKKEHIRQLLQMPRINSLFAATHQRNWNNEDIENLNNAFEKHLFSRLSDYTTPIPQVIETMQLLRADGIKIGSTTGYTAAMMEIVRPAALSKGYEVDSCVTPDLFPQGRPAPFMIFQNMINLNAQYLECVVKVGDTIEDIREGVRAGVWTVGCLKGSSILGLTEDETNAMHENELKEMTEKVREEMLQTGADYVIGTIAELPAIIHTINTKL